ncbi:hypothetical protein [Nocardia sp. NPDC058633]|uniref:hypothetical protein n=1 Tax=Nocardia sp. NPDC058633 TaxID=3346568 RepID=UPI003649DE8D
MADHTAAEQLAAIDIVAQLVNDEPYDGLARPLELLAAHITQRREHDHEIGVAFNRGVHSTGQGRNPAELGALIRAAVESTGSTITPPIVDGEIAEESDRD